MVYIRWFPGTDALTMPAFRQVGEKQLPQEVIFMAWSPKRDLIALANKVGEVILAFGLADTKKVILCDVEKPESLHSFSVSVPLTFMYWMEVTEENSVLTSFYNAEDESSLLLPKLPALPKNYSTTAKIFRLNALVLGGIDGFIEIYAYGMYKIATITGVTGSCLSLCLSSDLKSLSVVTEVDNGPDTDPEITYFQMDTSLLSTYLPEVTRMARKFTHISTLLQYIKLSLTCIIELQALLMNQLTVKVGRHVRGSEALLYHLSELKGMALWKQKYESLGLDASGIEEDPVPPELNKMTQKDITFVADFLTEHFNEAPELYSRKGKYFNVERVGQVRSTNNGLLAVEFGNFLNKSVNESNESSSYSCLDAHFYDDETITVILVENSEQEGKERILAQLPLSSICTEENQGMEFNWNSGQRLDMQRDGIPTCTVNTETQWRVLENMKASYITVNGIRKVSCVVSVDNHQPFELEPKLTN
ncbi:Anaphase-promoting complex subunit 4, partial [Ophiophagus hannah]